MDATTFVRELRASGLLDDFEVETTVRELRLRAATGHDLARELVRRRLLTLFQASRLLSSKGGQLVLGPYRLLDRAGGRRAFRAIHTALDRAVALKVLPLPPHDDRPARARFEREIGLAARLTHPNLVVALDAFEKGQAHVLVTEWVAGINLNEVVQRDGPLPIPTACGLALQAARGLHHAHEHGLLHQLVEPDNLLVAEGPASASAADLYLEQAGLACPPCKVINLGQAWAARADGGQDEGDCLAPEQTQQRPAPGPRSDLFGLGCCLYLALTGRPAFPRAGRRPRAAAPVERLRADVPSRLAAVVRRLLALRPADRFQSAEEVADVLAPFCTSLPRQPATQVTARTRQDTVADLAATRTTPTLTLDDATRRIAVNDVRRPHHWGWKLLLAAATLGCAAGLASHLLHLLD